MSASSIKQLVVDLQKASAPTTINDILKALTAAKVTVAMLHEFKCGAVVSKLRKHEDAGVSASAKALIKKWKGRQITLEKVQKLGYMAAEVRGCAQTSHPKMTALFVTCGAVMLGGVRNANRLLRFCRIFPALARPRTTILGSPRTS